MSRAVGRMGRMVVLVEEEEESRLCLESRHSSSELERTTIDCVKFLYIRQAVSGLFHTQD
jgi:protein-L-isoaspartate O-methyltransferase